MTCQRALKESISTTSDCVIHLTSPLRAAITTPFGKKHGMKSEDGPHAGDLPNLVVAADGTGKLTTGSHHLQALPGDVNLFDGIGVALAIHAGAGDQFSDPSGSSGARIACGRIIHD